jgi:hypothetical protein
MHLDGTSLPVQDSEAAASASSTFRRSYHRAGQRSARRVPSPPRRPRAGPIRATVRARIAEAQTAHAQAPKR